jgi:tetratricopeptide (TPR) repeat protein
MNKPEKPAPNLRTFKAVERDTAPYEPAPDRPPVDKSASTSKPVRRILLWSCVAGIVIMSTLLTVYQWNTRHKMAQFQKMEAFRPQVDVAAESQKWPEVLELSEAELQLVPDDAYAHWITAKAYYYTERYQEAVDEWQKCLALDPSWDSEAQPFLRAAEGALRVQKLGLPAAVITKSSEAREREVLRQQARDHLQKRNYDALEHQVSILRSGLIRGERDAYFPIGKSKLFYFYEGLSELPEAPLTTPGYNSPQSAQDVEQTQRQREAVLKALVRWTEERPDSVTAQLALANGYLMMGLAARGTKYADAVPEKGFAVLESRLKQAGEVLKQTMPYRRQDPMWYLTAMNVALFQGWKRADEDTLYREAVQAFPSCDELHIRRINCLMPRWHGEPGEWEQEAAQLAERRARERRSPKEGDLLYARLVWYVRGTQTNIFKLTDASWPRTQRGMEELLHRYPHSLEVASGYCVLAGSGRDTALVQKLHRERLKGKVDLDQWRTRSFFMQTRTWAYGNGPP